MGTTAYGSIDLKNSNAAVFVADGFSGSMLSVNGEYAAVSDTILPASMGGAKQTGSVLFLDLSQQQGKVINVESGDESGIAAVSADGQYIVTCAGGDSPSGTLRAYHGFLIVVNAILPLLLVRGFNRSFTQRISAVSYTHLGGRGKNTNLS